MMSDTIEGRSMSTHAQAKAFWASFVPDQSNTPSPSPAPEKDSTEGKKAPVKRIRIPIACVNCRHKKIKCDGQTPCSHCEKFKAECVYPAATKPVNHEYVETLENRLKSVESHLQGLLSMGMTTSGQYGDQASMESLGEHTDVDNGSCYSPSTAAASSRPASISSSIGNSNTSFAHMKQCPSASRALHKTLRGATNLTAHARQHTGEGASEESEEFVPDDSMGILSVLMGNLKIERDGSAKYLPNLSLCKEQSFTEARSYNSTSAPAALSTASELAYLDWDSVSLPRPYALPTNLLPPKAVGALIDIYFNSVHTFLPILHKTSFLTLCHEGEYRIPPFLLMAMCAVASSHASESELQSMGKFGSLAAHHVLFDHARSLLDTFIDMPRISTIQGLLLLTYYQVTEKRSGDYFRVRTYLNMAIQMARDMGLARDLHKSIDDIEATHTGDSISTTASIPLSSSSAAGQLSRHQTGPNPSHGSSKSLRSHGHSNKRKLAAVQQERRLAWLACFFLDGLCSSPMGFEFGVTHVHLEMRKLIREANYTTDTTQGATLIFWYLHLDLIQLYRRICLMYRFSGSISQDESIAMTTVLRGTEMLSIEHALRTWISTLPVHLVYTRKSKNSQDQQTPSETSLPSYYTLYLHRFYYSTQLLLYRPLIASAAHRGDLNNPDSPVSKCVNAAALLTEMGEIIFQNYSWPWPGCGLFAYQMLQAAEIHVYLMIAQARPDAHSLYHRTIDLVKGYASLAKLPDMEREIATMKQVIANYTMSPTEAMPAPVAHTPFSILQQLQHHQARRQQHQQYQQQEFVSNPSTSMAAAYTHVGSVPMCMSPTTPMIAHLTQKQLHLSQPTLHSHLSGPIEDAQMFSPPAQSSALFHSFPSSSAGAVVPADLYHIPPAGPGFSQPSPLSSFLHDMDAPSLSMYEQDPQDVFSHESQQSHQQQQLEQQQHQEPQYSYLHPSGILTGGAPPPDAVCDLINLSDSSNQQSTHPPFASSPEASRLQPLFTENDQQSRPSRLLSFPCSTPSSSSVPPKPPKRILPQSTGSTNSSSKSQSQKPPVPKKPSRLLDMGVTASLAPIARHHYQTLQSTYSQQQQQQQQRHQQQLQQGGSSTNSMMPPPLPGSPAAETGQRMIRVLQAQTQLYGLGVLKSSLNEGGNHENKNADSYVHEDESLASEDGHSDWDYSETHGYAFHYMKSKVNPHLQSQLPAHNRPQIL